MTRTSEPATTEARPQADRPRSRIRRDEAPAPRERGTERGGAFAASATSALARIVRLAAGVVAAIIVVGILLVVLKANPANDVVSTIHDGARDLVGPFDGMFTLDSSRATVAVNWGIAAVVYLIAGAVVARLIAAIGLLGVRGRRTVAS